MSDLALRPFACDAAPDFVLHLEQMDGRARPSGRLTAERLDGSDRFSLTRQDLVGELDFVRRVGRVRVAGTGVATLRSILLAILSLDLPRRSGLALHAAAVMRDGRAYVFPGRSGAGKSTLARASMGRSHLADDITLLTASATGGLLAHGSPFLRRGSPVVPLQVAVPVAAIVFPDRSGPRGVHRLRPAAAFARLLEAPISYCDDPTWDRTLFDCALAAASAGPCFVASLAIDEPVWPCLDVQMEVA